MKRIAAVRLATAVGLVAVLASPMTGSAQDRFFQARLEGYQETPNTLSTPASGRIVVRLRENGTELRYQLTYENIPSPVTQAHLHFGARGLSGAIVVFLCTNLMNGPAGTPPCPQSGTVVGEITAADMVDSAAPQGLAAGEFAELIRALRAGAVYANVHSEQFPSGEIRGQLR